MNADDDKCEDHHTTLSPVVLPDRQSQHAPFKAGRRFPLNPYAGRPQREHLSGLMTRRLLKDARSRGLVVVTTPRVLNAFRIRTKTGANFCIRCYPRIQTFPDLVAQSIWLPA